MLVQLAMFRTDLDLHHAGTTHDVSDRSGPSSRWARDSPNEGPDRSETSRVVLLVCNIIVAVPGSHNYEVFLGYTNIFSQRIL